MVNSHDIIILVLFIDRLLYLIPSTVASVSISPSERVLFRGDSGSSSAMTTVEKGLCRFVASLPFFGLVGTEGAAGPPALLLVTRVKFLSEETKV